MEKPNNTVYFRGFPANISVGELEVVFAKYGNVIRCFIHKNRQYGMVEFEDSSSCISAIRGLKNKPPLNLYCNIVKQSDKKDISMNNTMTCEGYDSVSYTEEDIYVDENNVVVDILMDPSTNQIYVPLRYAPNVRKIVKKVPCLLSNDNSFESNISNLKTNSDRKVEYENDMLVCKIDRNSSSKSSQKNFKKPVNKWNYSQKSDFKAEQTQFKSRNNTCSGSLSSCSSEDSKEKCLYKKSGNDSINHTETFKSSNSTNETFQYKTVELPVNKFTMVKIMHVENDYKGWVQLCEKLNDFETFSKRLLCYISNVKPTKLEIGKVGLTQFEEQWFRAIVLSISPKRIRFIDYGHEIILKDKFFDLPKQFSKVPGYAICIYLADGTPVKMEGGLTLSVKPTKTEDNVTTVHVKNGLYENELNNSFSSEITAHSSPTPIPRSNLSKLSQSLKTLQENTLSKLSAGMSGYVDISLKLSDKSVVAFFMLDNLFEELEKLDSLTPHLNSSFKPQVGDFICVEHDKWNRGIILKIESQSYEVALIDFGIIKTVSEVYPFSQEYKDVFQFSCYFTLEKDVLKKICENKQEEIFKISFIKNSTIFCKFNFSEDDIPVTLWNPEKENLNNTKNSSKASDQESKSVQLKNDEEVIIIGMTKNCLLIRNKECFRLLDKIESSIKTFLPKASKLQQPPTCGNMILSEFDGFWYRAVVTNIRKNEVDVSYVDYGNQEVKPLFALKNISSDIAKIPINTLIEIKLRDNADENLKNKRCLEYLSDLSERKEILTASFKHDQQENGIDLIFKDGKSLVEELKNMNKEFYMRVKIPGNNDPQITSIKLEEISIGDTEIKYLYPVDISQMLIAVSVNKPDVLHKVQVELVDQMTKYAKHIAPNSPYEPIKEEIILVQVEEKWFRGMCIEIENDEFTVFFIDYGFNETVSPNKIRRIPKEFVENYRALANFALIKGLPINPSETLINRLENLLLKNDVYKVEVLEKSEEETYIISFPSIQNILKHEKLL